MKVIVKENKAMDEVKYPCLMVHKGGKNIALFTDDGTGMIISGELLGTYEEFWAMDKFEPFTGTVELSND